MNPQGVTPATASEEQHFLEAVGVAKRHFTDNPNASQATLKLPNGRLVLIRRDGLFSMRGFDEKTGLLLFSSNPSTPFALPGTGFRSQTMKWPD